MEKTLVCDFDGTLVRYTTEIELIRFLIRTKKNKIYHYLLSCLSVPLNCIALYIFKRGTCFKAWTAFLSVEEQDLLFQQFSKEYIMNQLINKHVLEIIRNFKGKKILLTGCYEPLANYILKELHIYDEFDIIIGSKVGLFNFFVIQHPYGKDKINFLVNTYCSVGLGDSFSDKYFLDNCEKVYIVSGNQKLERYAVNKNWDYRIIHSDK